MYLPGMKDLLEAVSVYSLTEIALSTKEWENLSDKFDSVLDSLSPQEKYVITLRYNLNGNKSELEEKYNVSGRARKRKNLSYRLIGKEMAESIRREQPFSMERVRQIESMALRKLRHPLRRQHIQAMLGLEDKISFAEFLDLTGKFYPALSLSQPQKDYYLSTPIADLELSVRTANCLEVANFATIRNLVTHTESKMLRYRNFGRRSLNELKDILNEMGLNFGMTLEE